MDIIKGFLYLATCSKMRKIKKKSSELNSQ
jgi:hypothetical protein